MQFSNKKNRKKTTHPLNKNTISPAKKNDSLREIAINHFSDFTTIQMSEETNEITTLKANLEEYKKAYLQNKAAYDSLLIQANDFYTDLLKVLAVLAQIKPLILKDNVGMSDIMALTQGDFLTDIASVSMDLLTKYNQLTAAEMEIIKAKSEKQENTPPKTNILEGLLGKFF